MTVYATIHSLLVRTENKCKMSSSSGILFYSNSIVDLKINGKILIYFSQLIGYPNTKMSSQVIPLSEN